MSAARNLASLSKSEIANFVNSFDTVLTDCDGVLWLYDKVIAGSPDLLKEFQSMGKRVFYVTNNSTKTRCEFVNKCDTMGYSATCEDILSTSYLAACYLHDLGFSKKVYVVGSPGMTKELDIVGIQHTTPGPDPLLSNLESLVKTELSFDPEVGAVLVGFDPHISYPKMLKAASYLSDPNCVFVATNTDERFPLKHDIFPNLIVPGTGCIVRAIETCAGREAFKIGKPSSYMCEAVTKRFKVDPRKTLMIGDRCNTDILLGKRGGYQTLLVLTGVTTLEEVEQWKASGNPEEEELVPDYYINALGDLLPLLK